MVRTVWIGFICLIAICGLTAYKVGFAAPAVRPAADQAASASAAPLALTADAQAVLVSETRDGPATKTDRLDVDYLQDVPGKTLVHTIPIVISNPATPAATADPEKASAPEKNTRIVSRHWRSSYARLTRRHFRHHREAARPTTEAKTEPKTDTKTGHTGLFGWFKHAS